LQLEAEHADVEVERAIEVRDLEVHVPDADPRIDRRARPPLARSRLWLACHACLLG